MERQDRNTWPSDGNFIKIDWPLLRLKDFLREFKADHLYYYVVDTVKYNEKPDKLIYNKGSAPNFQGGIITLCTCKHYMRATGNFSENTWVAGLTSMDVGRKWGIENNLLFYLGKVSYSFPSYADVIDYLTKENPKIIDAKNACLNKRGDLYIPRLSTTDFYDPEQYECPCIDHVHKNVWHEDIKKYENRNGQKKYPNYLLFNKEYSFAWNKKALYLNRGSIFNGNKKAAITSGSKHVGLQEFLNALTES